MLEFDGDVIYMDGQELGTEVVESAGNVPETVTAG